MKHSGKAKATPPKHSPSTGNGSKGGAKPALSAVSQRSANGSILKALTKALWRKEN